MGAARKLNAANAMLKGVECHDGFLGEETLLRLVDNEGFKSKLQNIQNEKLRTFRQAYLGFAKRDSKLSLQGKFTDKREKIIKEWFSHQISYFGYDDFKPKAMDCNFGEGKIPFCLCQRATNCNNQLC